METDATHPGMSGPHPTIAQLRDPTHPGVAEHVESCSMCQSIVAAEDVPIPLDLPKGLVSETAFRWPPDPIARGGMAQIYLAEDKRLGRSVILKSPREDDSLPADMRDMFQRRVSAEARVLAKLQHPGIVTIYELGKASVGWPFCVLEKVEGVSLRDRLDELADRERSGGVQLTRERLELVSSLVGIAEALAYAHEQRVVHRDVTPNNILLGKRGEATLIDWGIARDLDAPTMTEPTIHDMPPSMSGRMVTISAGTPPYIPLEQSQGRKANPSFDVYSFGICLYEVVAGKTPFEWKHVDGPNARNAQVEAFLAWLQSGETPPAAMPRDRELSGIVARAMAHDPGERFSADELVLALKQYLTGDLVFSHRYSLTGRLGRWARQHRAVAVTMAFLVLSAVAGALVWAQLSRQAKEEAELRVIAASARADASEKERAADAANREAEAAKQLAEQAQKDGKNADELRRQAERKRHAAEEMRRSAEAAAKDAKGDADEAIKRFQEAMKAKDDAEIARDLANGLQATAEKERDTAKLAQASAEHERDASAKARDAADHERDAAKQTAAAAEKERDAAIAARAATEKERDEARRKVAELEAKLKEQEAQQPVPEKPPAVTP